MLRKIKDLPEDTDNAYMHLVFLVQREIYETFGEQSIDLSKTKGGTPSKGWQQNLMLSRIQQWVVSNDFKEG